MARKYTWLKDLSQVIMEGNYHMFMGTHGARLDMSEKSIIFSSVTFQNIVQNSCNTGLVTHLQVDLPWKLKSAR
jgi:hypothetical protein